MGKTSGVAAQWRSSIFLDRGWKYGMGIWGPTTMRISATAGAKQFSIEAVGSGPDYASAVSLRHGATYYFFIPAPGAGAVRKSFVYDARLPMTSQELDEAPTVTVSNMVVSVYNSTMLKSDFNAIETAKIHQHYGWSLLLCGANNRMEVSPEIL